MSNEVTRSVDAYGRARQRAGDVWGWHIDTSERVVEFFVNPARSLAAFPEQIAGMKVVITPLPAAKEQGVG